MRGGAYVEHHVVEARLQGLQLRTRSSPLGLVDRAGRGDIIQRVIVQNPVGDVARIIVLERIDARLPLRHAAVLVNTKVIRLVRMVLVIVPRWVRLAGEVERGLHDHAVDRLAQRGAHPVARRALGAAALVDAVVCVFLADADSSVVGERVEVAAGIGARPLVAVLPRQLVVVLVPAGGELEVGNLVGQEHAHLPRGGEVEVDALVGLQLVAPVRGGVDIRVIALEAKGGQHAVGRELGAAGVRHGQHWHGVQNGRVVRDAVRIVQVDGELQAEAPLVVVDQALR
mmetsp:Transcript_33634/g.73411  ORF Transcript_33634/g.73411 Transcript_33634/m.73411 type:complete len:285 (-) Transcript_33634:1055-1909(-)